ncbi:hypothetical protein MHO82_24145 [Vibrio sp. Of7-15]|uniref:hypothetical protein n=1 Tax=Vibrio sp. Of7-15 TaxID=2724879 RepID=UPI001EF1AFD8|nr:hypothetical protein [Vibrio sp. Of7-15]MCG7499962.1 hypothetical protein [Vibrio sp. Of7-15]
MIDLAFLSFTLCVLIIAYVDFRKLYRFFKSKKNKYLLDNISDLSEEQRDAVYYVYGIRVSDQDDIFSEKNYGDFSYINKYDDYHFLHGEKVFIPKRLLYRKNYIEEMQGEHEKSIQCINHQGQLYLLKIDDVFDLSSDFTEEIKQVRVHEHLLFSEEKEIPNLDATLIYSRIATFKETCFINSDGIKFRHFLLFLMAILFLFLLSAIINGEHVGLYKWVLFFVVMHKLYSHFFRSINSKFKIKKILGTVSEVEIEGQEVTFTIKGNDGVSLHLPLAQTFDNAQIESFKSLKGKIASFELNAQELKEKVKYTVLKVNDHSMLGKYEGSVSYRYHKYVAIGYVLLCLTLFPLAFMASYTIDPGSSVSVGHSGLAKGRITEISGATIPKFTSTSSYGWDFYVLDDKKTVDTGALSLAHLDFFKERDAVYSSHPFFRNAYSSIDQNQLSSPTLITAYKDSLSSYAQIIEPYCATFSCSDIKKAMAKLWFPEQLSSNINVKQALSEIRNYDPARSSEQGFTAFSINRLMDFVKARGRFELSVYNKIFDDVNAITLSYKPKLILRLNEISADYDMSLKDLRHMNIKKIKSLQYDEIHHIQKLFLNKMNKLINEHDYIDIKGIVTHIQETPEFLIMLDVSPSVHQHIKGKEMECWFYLSFLLLALGHFVFYSRKKSKFATE